MTASNGETPPRVSFPEISSHAYEHPTDRAALAALRKVKGFDLMLKQVFGAVPERRLRLLYLANAVRVGPRQLPDVHAVLEEVCECLDLSDQPELFLVSDPRVNAMAIGMNHPFVVLNSSLLQLLDREELRCVVAHEIAHILSGHALYKTMLVLLQSMVRWVLRGPLLIPSLPVLLALKEWDRKSELSADRASLLVTQDLELTRRVMIKLAGGAGRESYSLEEFERQAEEYRESGGLVDKFFKVLNLLEVSHPFPVLRVGELRHWAESEEYERILAGDYPRRDADDGEDDVRTRVAEAASSYREDFADGRDAMGDLVRSVGEAGKNVWEALFGPTVPRGPADEDVEGAERTD